MAGLIEAAAIGFAVTYPTAQAAVYALYTNYEQNRTIENVSRNTAGNQELRLFECACKLDEKFTAKVQDAISHLIGEFKLASGTSERGKELHLRARRLKNALTRVSEGNKSLVNGRPLLPQDRQLGVGEKLVEMSDQNLQDANFVNEMLASINETGAPSSVHLMPPRGRPPPEREVPSVTVRGGISSFDTTVRQGSSSLKNRKGSPHGSADKGSPRTPRDRGQRTPR